MNKGMIIAAVLLAASCANRANEGSTPGDCEDGEDNDLDGRSDCDDDGCIMATHCVNLKQKAELEKEKADRAARQAKSKTAAEKNTAGPTVNGDGILIQVGHNGADISWTDANEYCNNLKLQGKNDWRLPTEKEAVKIVETEGIIKKTSYVMWTSQKKGKNRAVIVGITGGAVNDLGVQSKGEARARCVLDVGP